MRNVNLYTLAYADKEIVLHEDEYKRYQNYYNHHNMHGIPFEAFVFFMVEEKGILVF